MNDTPLPAPAAAPEPPPVPGWVPGVQASPAAPSPTGGHVDYFAPAVAVQTAAPGPINYTDPVGQVVPGAAQPYPLGATHYPAPPDPIGARPVVGERIDLPSGGWVQLRHPDDLRSRHRNHVMSTMPLDASGFDMAVVTRMQRAVAEVMIVSWSLPYAPDALIPSLQPPDPATGVGSTLDEVSLRDEDVLMEALRPVMDLLTPKKVDPGQHADPNSPTGPEGASGRA